MDAKPGRVLFSNDTTNIESCSSSYSPRRYDDTGNKIRKEFTDQKLCGSIDETADTGIDVHMLQPGLGWVPWWKSSVYPFEKHIEFMAHFGKSPSDSSFADYMARGGDMVATFSKRCREKGLSPFISIRMNDSHGHEFSAMEPEKISGMAWHAFCPVHVNHPEWRLSTDVSKDNWNFRVLNWAIPEVRAYKFSLIREIIENYDLDGFELDFMRHHNYFNPEETNSAQRRSIMNGFIADVRQALDRSSVPGRKKWLCVRVPCYLEAHDVLGFYLPEMVKVGVDLVNLSAHYYTVQQNDLAEVCKLIPGTPVYLEMCHTTLLSKKRLSGNPYNNFLFRRTTDEQYYTAAYLALSRGAYGVSAFNFVYYREHAQEDRGPFNEPPFHIFQHIADREWLSGQPQHYILTSGFQHSSFTCNQMPAVLQKGRSRTFKLDMVPPAGGWKTDGRLRLLSEEDMEAAGFSVRINGVPAEPTGDISEPYENPYTPMLGNETNTRAYTVPKDLVKDGVNSISVLMEAGGEVRFNYLDIGIK